MMRRCLHLIAPPITLLAMSSCGTVESMFDAEETSVVYALGPRESYVSPLQQSLPPVSPALKFEGTSFMLTGAHEKVLQNLVTSVGAGKPHYLIAGYTAPLFSEDYARSLSERRAQAVRQRLIELGMEAQNLQSVGFGHDAAPAGPSSGVVVIYEQP